MQRSTYMLADQTVSITIPADTAWIPLLQAAAENGAGVFDLDPNKTPRLTMAMEELLVHLAATLPKEDISFTLRAGSTFVAVDAEFASTGRRSFRAEYHGNGWTGQRGSILNHALAPGLENDGQFPCRTTGRKNQNHAES